MTALVEYQTEAPTTPETIAAQDALVDSRRKHRKAVAHRQRIIVGSLSVVGGLVVWVVAAAIVHNQLFLVGPWQVVRRAGQLFANGTLGDDLTTSGEEFLGGLVAAICFGVPVGILIGISHRARNVMQPWISGLYSTPVVALSPLLILWFGIGLVSKIVVIFSVAVFPIITNTQAGITGLDPDLVEMARCFQFTRRTMIRHIYLRGSLPLVLTGIRLAIGRAIVGVVVAELFGARSGLGYEIEVTSQAYDTAGLFACIILLAFIGVVFSSIAIRMERMAAPWLQK
jgi:NitT/TauT family transport system permease protein